MVARLAPNASTTSQSRCVRPVSRGRATAASTRALVTSRSHTIAVGEISPKRPLAIAAPSWTERMPTSTRPTGPSRVWLGRRVTAPAYSARCAVLEAVHREAFQRAAGMASLGGEVVEPPVGDQRGEPERLARSIRAAERLPDLRQVGRGPLQVVEVVLQHPPGRVRLA